MLVSGSFVGASSLVPFRFSATSFDTSGTKHSSTDSCSEASTTWFGSLPEVAELKVKILGQAFETTFFVKNHGSLSNVSKKWV